MSARKVSTCVTDVILEEEETSIPIESPDQYRAALLISGLLKKLRIQKHEVIFYLCFSGSESPAPFEGGNKGRQAEGERIRQIAKTLIGPEIAEKQLSNEISAPYEVPQYPIEQIETKLIRYIVVSPLYKKRRDEEAKENIA